MSRRLLPAALVVSAVGLGAILGYEGYTEYAAPPVPGDVPTVGYGTTVYPNGEVVKAGDRITRSDALNYARHDVGVIEKSMRACIKAKIAQHEWDAFVSLAYNIGPVAFCRSTLVRKLNAGDYAGACAEISRWDKFHGKPLKGLTNRRAQERKTCEGH